jgi:hypothetical protein
VDQLCAVFDVDEILHPLVPLRALNLQTCQLVPRETFCVLSIVCLVDHSELEHKLIQFHVLLLPRLLLEDHC